MFCACMIGGTLYGTGQLYENETPENRVLAMKVRASSNPVDWVVSNRYKVLVALRNCLLLRFDFLQNFSVHFSYANHC